VTIRLAVGDFLWMVHCDDVSISHRYGDMPSQSCTDARTHAWTNAHLILYLFIAMHCIGQTITASNHSRLSQTPHWKLESYALNQSVLLNTHQNDLKFIVTRLEAKL